MEPGNADRRAVNLFSLVVALGLVAVAVKVADGSFTSRINRISDNLNKALDDVLHLDGANYTELVENASYHSNAQHYHHKGLAGLYNLTVWFMDLLVKRDVYPEGKVLRCKN